MRHVPQGSQAGIDAMQRELASGQPFDIVFTDLGMPEVDGHAVASTVKRQSPATPVVLLTGWGEGLQRDSRPNPDIDVVLSKPLRRDDLNEVIVRLLER